MRKSSAIRLLPVLLMATIVFATSCGGGASYATPVDTVNTFLDAYEDMDADKLLDCFDISISSEVREETEMTIEMMKEMGDWSISITNRDISIVSQTGDSATVSVRCDMKATFEGETQTDSVDDTWTLVKKDNKWLLTELPD